MRNLEQTRGGGYDLVGFEPFAFEIKRTERPDLRGFWLQAVTQCGEHDIPVVMYRKNRQPWRFLISARSIGNKNGYILLEAREFVEWANNTLEAISA